MESWLFRLWAVLFAASVALSLFVSTARPRQADDGRFAPPVKKVGSLTLAEGEAYNVDNYTEVLLDGEAQRPGTLPEGAKLVKVQVDGRRVVRLFFERLK